MHDAFGCSLRRWADGVGEYRARAGPLLVPEPLRGRLRAVLGADTRPQARPHFRIHQSPSPTDVSYLPPQVATAYSFPPTADGTGETIGLLELGGGYSAADLSTFFAEVGLAVPSVTAVGVDGGSNAPTGDPNGPDGEVELDVEVAGSCAPGAQLVVYFAPNTDQGILDGLTAALHDRTPAPSIVSVSWGAPEESWTGQAMSALNDACADAATLGVSVFAAAGDQGASDGAKGGALEVDFPASSPYVIGCGGTQLRLGPPRTEVVWNELAIGEGATGGGVSAVYPPPSFQSDASVPDRPDGQPGRGVPDVAGNADPATGYRIVVDGAWTVIGGTSAVGPLWAALAARWNQMLGRPVGFVTPSLYATAARPGFTDIVSGNNDGFLAGPGWDACTGWGSPIGNRLASALSGADAPGATGASPPTEKPRGGRTASPATRLGP